MVTHALQPTAWNLTRREAQIVQHLAAGIPRERVAHALGCSLVVLNEHVRTIHDKMGADAVVAQEPEVAQELQLV